jgi:hypothetical protein
MTRLEAAFAEAAKLPPDEQEAFANWLLEELASERRGTQALSGSGDKLAHLADEALAEHHARRTCPLDPDTL